MSRRDLSDIVSDHVLVRWLERIGFVNTAELRAQIYAEVREALNSGASSFTVNGTEYRFKNGRVVTLIDQRKACGPLNWQKK